jgi:electron transfer flavoprotein alpha subunit
MAEVVVLVDHVEGEIRRSTFELLTVARVLGDPSAGVVGASGTAGTLVEALGRGCSAGSRSRAATAPS